MVTGHAFGFQSSHQARHNPPPTSLEQKNFELTQHVSRDTASPVISCSPRVPELQPALPSPKRQRPFLLAKQARATTRMARPELAVVRRVGPGHIPPLRFADCLLAALALRAAGPPQTPGRAAPGSRCASMAPA